MKIGIFYGSTHGRTRKVVAEAAQHLSRASILYDVQSCDPLCVAQFDVLLFFCPTYGDEELQDDMEQFLRRLDQDLTGKLFAVCELGSYYGYEDFAFGAMRMIRKRLLDLHARELCEPLSLDSFPRVPWRHLLDWIDYLKGRLNENERHCLA